MKYVRAEWEKFEAECVPEQTSPQLRLGLQAAFFAGFKASVNFMLVKAEAREDPTDEDVDVIAAVFEELDEYATNIETTASTILPKD